MKRIYPANDVNNIGLEEYIDETDSIKRKVILFVLCCTIFIALIIGITVYKKSQYNKNIISADKFYEIKKSTLSNISNNSKSEAIKSYLTAIDNRNGTYETLGMFFAARLGKVGIAKEIELYKRIADNDGAIFGEYANLMILSSRLKNGIVDLNKTISEMEKLVSQKSIILKNTSYLIMASLYAQSDQKEKAKKCFDKISLDTSNKVDLMLKQYITNT